eukprot:256350-Pleurochrysis_carterae.AAC.1
MYRQTELNPNVVQYRRVGMWNQADAPAAGSPGDGTTSISVSLRFKREDDAQNTVAPAVPGKSWLRQCICVMSTVHHIATLHVVYSTARGSHRHERSQLSASGYAWALHLPWHAHPRHLRRSSPKWAPRQKALPSLFRSSRLAPHSLT